MNRRKFVKFLGKATVASGIALAVGLPEKLIRANPNAPVLSGDFTTGKSWVSTRTRTGVVCHQFMVRNGSLRPFKSISFMLSGKNKLAFHNEIHNNIKVGDYVSVCNMDSRQEWISGWAGEVYANVVTLYNPDYLVV